MWQKEGEAKMRQNELTSERGRTINRPTQRRVCVRASDGAAALVVQVGEYEKGPA